MIQTLADTIIWYAGERHKECPHQNINSAIHAVNLDIAQILMKFMAEQKGGHEAETK
jgi:hypothetical protein